MTTGRPPIIRASTDYRRLLRTANAPGLYAAGGGGGPMVIAERWPAAIDTTNWWTRTLGGAGAATVVTTTGWRNLPLVSAAALDTVNVVAKSVTMNPLGVVPTATNNIYQRAVMEWEAKFTDVANMDNTKTAMVIAYLSTPTRDANGAIGFVLAADALNTLTDSGGTEEINVVTLPSTGAAPTLTVINRYMIVVHAAKVEFYVNGELVKTHETANSLPTSGLVPGFYNVSDGTVNSTLAIGPNFLFLERDE